MGPLFTYFVVQMILSFGIGPLDRLSQPRLQRDPLVQLQPHQLQ